jgi:hypothetical protein
MGLAVPEDHVARFTGELLRTGSMLSELVADLVEAVPLDAYPGERPAAVVIEMVTGTIRTALADTDERQVHRATDLIVEARERVLEHLQLALGLSRRMGHGAGHEPWRTYG